MQINKITSLGKTYLPQPLNISEGLRLEQEVELTLKEITSADSFASWWQNQDPSIKYSLFAIILATGADEEAAKLIASHRTENAQISGPKCCFLYFKREGGTRFDFDYHSRCATELTRALGIDRQEMPYIFFFEEPHKGDGCGISLKNKGASDSVGTLREIFDFLDKEDSYTVASAQHYKGAIKFKSIPQSFERKFGTWLQ